MKKIVALVLLAASMSAFAATAFFTGQQEMVQTVTGRVAWRCHYNYAGNTFTAIFEGSCPGSIQVR